jgi:2,3-bisphosphoglycerate-dependent phosphoglycerate mutase
VSVEVVFETHAASEDNETGIATGWLPGRLSAAGCEQARELGERRREDGLAVVFVSDLGRAVETAEIAFAGSSLPVVTDERLRECNCTVRLAAGMGVRPGVDSRECREPVDLPDELRSPVTVAFPR